MLDRVYGGAGAFAFRQEGKTHQGSSADRPPRARSRRQSRPCVESLEGRALLAAALATISPVTVPSFQGFQVPLNGSAAVSPQTFTATSDNPDITVTPAAGKFFVIDVSHTAFSSTDKTFAGVLVYQLFDDLTPLTASKIESFTNSGFYNGKVFHRIASGFPGATDFILQGGSATGTGADQISNFPPAVAAQIPFADEFNQQLTFDGAGQLAMANSGPNTNETQFFFTTGAPTFLDFKHTIFGQLVSAVDTVNAGANLVQEMTQVQLVADPLSPSSITKPASPITMTNVTIVNANPNGVLHIDATQARQGETANINVTAFQPSTNTTANQSFKVTVGVNNVPSTVTFNLQPVAFKATVPALPNTPTPIQLAGDTANPGSGQTLVFALVKPPTNGTISGFDPTTGKLTYTPNAGFQGIDTLQFNVTDVGAPTPSKTSLPATVALDVAAVPVNTIAVRQVDRVLIVTPPPPSGHGTNTIVISQLNDPTNAANDKIQVTVNGGTDVLQPLVSGIDQIIVYGSKGKDHVMVDPSLDPAIVVSLDGGHGGHGNVLQAGAGPTREHGWFGFNTLIGGTGPNELVGRAGHVKFKPTATTDQIFAGRPHIKLRDGHVVPPDGTFYKFVKGHLVPITGPQPHKKTKA